MSLRIGIIFALSFIWAICVSAERENPKNGNEMVDGTSNSWMVIGSVVLLILIGVASVSYFVNAQKRPSSKSSVSEQLQRLVQGGKLDRRILGGNQNEMRILQLVDVLILDQKLQSASLWTSAAVVSSWRDLQSNALRLLNNDSMVPGEPVTSENLKARCDELAATMVPHVREMELIDDADEVNEILPRLFIGNYADSQDLKQLQKRKIRRIVSVGTDPEQLAWLRFQREIDYRQVVLKNYGATYPGAPESGIADIVDMTMDYMYRAINADKVAISVHSRGGTLRAPVYVAAYILTIAQPDITVEDAMLLIRAKRPTIIQAPHFNRQLQDYLERGVQFTRNGLENRYGQLDRIDFTQELAKIKGNLG